jgi:hypothetical protein
MKRERAQTSLTLFCGFPCAVEEIRRLVRAESQKIALQSAQFLGGRQIKILGCFARRK